MFTDQQLFFFPASRIVAVTVFCSSVCIICIPDKWPSVFSSIFSGFCVVFSGFLFWHLACCSASLCIASPSSHLDHLSPFSLLFSIFFSLLYFYARSRFCLIFLFFFYFSLSVSLFSFFPCLQRFHRLRSDSIKSPMVFSHLFSKKDKLFKAEKEKERLQENEKLLLSRASTVRPHFNPPRPLPKTSKTDPHGYTQRTQSHSQQAQQPQIQAQEKKSQSQGQSQVQNPQRKPVHAHSHSDSHPPEDSPPPYSSLRKSQHSPTKTTARSQSVHTRSSVPPPARKPPAFSPSRFSFSPRSSSSSSRYAREKKPIHPLNLPPDELRRWSAMAAARDESVNAMDIDPKTPNGVEGSTEKSPTPPPHRSSSGTAEADSFKLAGNKFFKDKNYTRAIEEFSKGESIYI